MKIKNETEIQLMKILFKTSGKKPTKNITSQRAYPHGVEMKYFRQLKGFFKPLTDYVNKYINENIEPLLRGDSTEIHLDTIPGQSFRNMIYNLENWLSIYMPNIADLSKDSNNNVIFTALGKTADETKAFGDKEFQKIIEKGIHVSVPTSSPWWDDMKSSWAENNYTLITSNAKKYVEQINNLTEQAIVNGLSPKKLKEQIMKATEGLSEKHCKLIARDQMGKLNGNITEAQMQEIGLELYVWSTAYDDRVRDSHAVMEGLLCRWDDASVCSYDNGKTWVNRPSNAVQLHPGQDIQCRCVALSFYPELEAEMTGEPWDEITSNLPPVQETSQFVIDDAINDFIKEGLLIKNDRLENYINDVFYNTDETFDQVMSKIISNNKKSVYYDLSKIISEYDPYTNILSLTHLNDPRTLVHEMGHFLDYILGKEIKVVSRKTRIENLFKTGFSLTEEFSSIYQKEAKNMIQKIKDQIIIENGNKKISNKKMELFIRQKLSDFSKLDNDSGLVLMDMFTAFERKSYGGHKVDYFYNKLFDKSFPELKGYKIFSEGWAELNETFFSKDLPEDVLNFFNENFPETKKLIYQKIQDYLRS